jgi:hypothetical protein
MVDEAVATEEEIEVEDISSGRKCPFMMVVRTDDRPALSEENNCVGQDCAMFQSMDEDYAERDDDGNPVMVDVLDEAGNPIKDDMGNNIKQAKIQRKITQGCTFALQARLSYLGVLNTTQISSSGYMISNILRQLAVPVNMNQKPGGGIIVPQPGFQSPAGR